jgi:hypothetical protein
LTDWDESEHPRDARGRFRDKTGDWARLVSEQAGRGPWRRSEGRDLTGDWAMEYMDELADAEDAWEGAGRPYGDPVIGIVASAQAFDRLPVVGTQQELDDAVAAGGVELWRGYQPAGYDRHDDESNEQAIARYVREWREGEYKAGNGIYGQGVYMSVDREAAKGFAMYGARYGYDRDPDDDLLTSPHGRGDRRSLQRQVLSPDARVISWNDPRLAAAGAFRWDTPGMWDRGRLAAALGYDAMIVPEGQDDGSGLDRTQYVVFNRTALLVEDGPP